MNQETAERIASALERIADATMQSSLLADIARANSAPSETASTIADTLLMAFDIGDCRALLGRDETGQWHVREITPAPES